MTVDLIPQSEQVGIVGLANATWFALLDDPLRDLLPDAPHSNDEFAVDAARAQRCAEALDTWMPPEEWGEPWLIELLIGFMRECGGFTTA